MDVVNLPLTERSESPVKPTTDEAAQPIEKAHSIKGDFFVLFCNTCMKKCIMCACLLLLTNTSCVHRSKI